MPSKKKSYNYIFAVVDFFSKFIYLVVSNQVNGSRVLTRLKRQAVIFGNPKRLISEILLLLPKSLKSIAMKKGLTTY